MDIRRTFVALVVVVLAVGSLGGAAAARIKPRPFPDLDRYPRPGITGAEIVAGLEQFVADYPLRQALLPNNDAAAEFLAAEAEGLGYRTRTIVASAGTPERDVKIVEALKRGHTRPDEWIVLVAH